MMKKWINLFLSIIASILVSCLFFWKKIITDMCSCDSLEIRIMERISNATKLCERYCDMFTFFFCLRRSVNPLKINSHTTVRYQVRTRVTTSGLEISTFFCWAMTFRLLRDVYFTNNRRWFHFFIFVMYMIFNLNYE